MFTFNRRFETHVETFDLFATKQENKQPQNKQTQIPAHSLHFPLFTSTFNGFFHVTNCDLIPFHWVHLSSLNGVICAVYVSPSSSSSFLSLVKLKPKFWTKIKTKCNKRIGEISLRNQKISSKQNLTKHFQMTRNITVRVLTKRWMWVCCDS